MFISYRVVHRKLILRQLDPTLANARHMLGKEIAASADVDSRTAFEVLRLLLNRRADSSRPRKTALTRKF